MTKVLNGRYQVKEMIGAGGMADVFVGEDLRLSRQVAIKILRADLARDPSFVTRFRKEALAAAGLNHPGIVSVYDTGEDGGDSYIVMELVIGRTLRQVLNSGEKISLHGALEIVAGILDALDYSHLHGIVHRDIKPGNIMLTDDGQVKVMDFGIARALDDIAATITNTFNVIGTAQYLSPEQATGEAADARSDIYSVGCLLYELIAGQTPFTGDTPVSIAYQHVSAELTPITRLAPSTPIDVETILSVALAKDPQHRYQDAKLMLADVKRVIQGEPVTTKIRRILPRRSILTIGTALVVLVTASFFIATRQSPNTQVELPSVVGLTQAEAVVILKDFTINVNRAPDPRIPKGRVASQTPLAASKVIPGSSITLTISDGAGDTTVPIDLVGQPLDAARIQLAAAGLLIGKTIAVNSDQQPGYVLQVDPVPGSVIPAGSGVTLTIASGNISVPNLVGLTEIEATTQLVQAGFVVQTIEATDSTQPNSVVLAQAPAPDSIQIIGSKVTITVNRVNP